MGDAVAVGTVAVGDATLGWVAVSTSAVVDVVLCVRTVEANTVLFRVL